MPKKLTPSAIELEELARQYKTKTEFRAASRRLFNLASELGVVADVFGGAHERWTDVRVAAEASKYPNPREFSLACSGGYHYARRMGLVEVLFPNMRVKWTPERLAEEASKYKSKKQFKTESEAAYQAARRLGLIDELFDNVLVTWDAESAVAEGKKFKTRFEFQVGRPSAYNYAKRHGLLDSIGFSKGYSTFDPALPAKVYVVDTTLLDGTEAIMFGISNRHPSRRYLEQDKSRMRNRLYYAFSTGGEAYKVENDLRKILKAYRIPPGLSPFMEKKGTRGEIVFSDCGRGRIDAYVFQACGGGPIEW